MSAASLCSSTLKSQQISGLGGGLKLQKPSVSQPSSLTFIRYCFFFYLANVVSFEFHLDLVLFIGFSVLGYKNSCFRMKPS